MKLIDKLLIGVILMWVLLGVGCAVESVYKYVNTTQQKIAQLDTILSKSIPALQTQISTNKQEVSKSVDNLKSEINTNYNVLALEDMQTTEDLNKTKIDIEEQRIIDNLKFYSEINKIENKISDVDKDLIINGSVQVISMMGTGSGTVLKKTEDSMYILTCYHVVATNYEALQKGMKIGVTIGYAKEDKTGKTAGMTVYGAEIIKVDIENDLALLKTFFNDESLRVINLATIDPIRGDTIYTVGHPLGLMRAISKGILTSKVEGFYITDNTTTYGNSGGGLFNIRGELIGVPSQVKGYGGGIDENGEVSFIPESGLGMSISLLRIKDFLIGTEI